MANCELAEASILTAHRQSRDSRSPAAASLPRFARRRPPRRAPREADRSDAGEGALRHRGRRFPWRAAPRPPENARSSPRARHSASVPPATGRPEVPVTSVSPPTSSIRAPNARSATVIAAVSSLASKRLSTLLPSARAAITSRRLVKLLDDGASSVPSTGPAGTISSTARESQSGGRSRSRAKRRPPSSPHLRRRGGPATAAQRSGCDDGAVIFPDLLRLLGQHLPLAHGRSGPAP